MSDCAQKTEDVDQVSNYNLTIHLLKLIFVEKNIELLCVLAHLNCLHLELL